MTCTWETHEWIKLEHDNGYSVKTTGFRCRKCNYRAAVGWMGKPVPNTNIVATETTRDPGVKPEGTRLRRMHGTSSYG